MISIPQEKVTQVCPNIIFEVDGETPLYEKLSPFIDRWARWLEQNVVQDTFVEPVIDICQSVIVNYAMADAVPALDIVATPNGFAVVATQELAPASKDRTERFIQSLRDQADSDLCVLIDRLVESPEYRITPQGCKFCESLVCSPSSIADYKIKGIPILESFEQVKMKAISFEMKAIEYIGQSLMKIIIEFNAFSALPETLVLASANVRLLVQAVLKAESKWIYMFDSRRHTAIDDDRALFHLLSPALKIIKHDQALYQIWVEESGQSDKECDDWFHSQGAFYL